MEIEKRRPPFSILSEEKQQTIQLGKLTFKIRIDRIDQHNNEKIIIDYKTGKTSITDWQGERPNEPQLPLYAVHTKNLAGILFAQLRADEIRFKGITKPDITIEQCQTADDEASWEHMLDDWEKTLEQLADDFHEGDARVAPKQGEQTCQYCDYRSLCRVDERPS